MSKSNILVKTSLNKFSVSIELTPDEIAVYQAAAKQKWQESQAERIRKHKRAWELARLAPALLKEQFKATKVMVFGSLVRNDCFTLWSDVDIAGEFRLMRHCERWRR